MPALENVVGAVMLAAAAIAALGYLVNKGRSVVRFIRNAVRVLNVVHDVVERELDYNGGGSMKDDVTGIALATGKLQRHVDELDKRLTDHLRSRGDRP